MSNRRSGSNRRAARPAAPRAAKVRRTRHGDEAEAIIKKFADQLARARKTRKWSQQKLGKKAGLGSTAVGMYERKLRTPSWPTAVMLAKTLEIDLGSFMKEEPIWNVLNANHPQLYINGRNLAVQDMVMREQEAVRQLTTRLPIRIMDKAHVDSHKEEMPDNESRDALVKIHHEHKLALEKMLEKGKDLSFLVGMMRRNDFLKLLYMEDPPYGFVGCNPCETKKYLKTYLMRLVRQGYRLVLVSDSKTREVLIAHKVAHYETVATVGNRLAIRRLYDFEIAWSFEKAIIDRFNKVLNELSDHNETKVLTCDDIETCCTLMGKALRRVPDHAFSELKNRQRWQEEFGREVEKSGFEWLRRENSVKRDESACTPAASS